MKTNETIKKTALAPGLLLIYLIISISIGPTKQSQTIRHNSFCAISYFSTIFKTRLVSFDSVRPIRRLISSRKFVLMSTNQIYVSQNPDELGVEKPFLLSSSISSDETFLVSNNEKSVEPETPNRPLFFKRKRDNVSNKRRFYSDSRANITEGITRKLNEKPIGIVGGGVGGVALALALQNKGIPFKLFEKDSAFLSRKQGYGLTLQQGIMVLRDLGFTEIDGGVVSTTHASYSSNGQVLGKYGLDVIRESNMEEKVIEEFQQNESETNLSPSDSQDLPSSTSTDCKSGVISVIGKARHNVHLPRQLLREMILNRISKDNVIWNKKLVSYEDSCSVEGVTLKFEDNTSFPCSLLVAADGIYSLIRKIKLPEANLEYLGLMVILGITKNINQTKEVKMVRQWLDGSTRIFTMPYDPTRTMWQLSFPCEEAEAMSLAGDVTRLREVATSRCAHWNTEIQLILDSTDPELISGHPVYDRTPVDPSVLRGNSGSRVTMIGDAIHPMSPFKGQGANQALVDALALTKAINNSDLVHPLKRPICESLFEFEKEMCTRSANKVLKSRKSAVSLHSSAALAQGNFTRAWVASQNTEQNYSE